MFMSSALSQRKGGRFLIHGSTSWGSLVIWIGPDKLAPTEQCSCSVWVKLHYLLIVLPGCKWCLCIGTSCGQGNTYVLPELACIFLEKVMNSRRELETVFQLGGTAEVGDRWSRSWLTCSVTSGEVFRNLWVCHLCSKSHDARVAVLCWGGVIYTVVSKHFDSTSHFNNDCHIYGCQHSMIVVVNNLNYVNFDLWFEWKECIATRVITKSVFV